MLADQLIYTACGKDKTGAFSVWSMSQSVKTAEADQIVKLMSYRKSKNAPFEPTEQEIKTMFPKKYAFFVLSTGRYCVAKTTYIGKVYSDLDARNGNFIIHAYIFDELGVNPFFMFGSTKFRSELTYREWHDMPAPDYLPQEEIEFKPTAADAALRSIVQQGKLEQVKDIVQAIINNADTENTICFNDTEENQATIYSLIGALLPAQLQSKATFCTDYSPQMDYTLSGMNVKPPMLRNIFPDLLGMEFNYAEEREAGGIVFDFTTGVHVDLPNGKYTDGIDSVLGNNTGLFAAIRYSEKVDEVMKKCGCDINTAASVYAFLNSRDAAIADPEEYLNNVNLAISGGYTDAASAASKIYSAVYADKTRGGSVYARLVRFAYENGDDRIKRGVYEYFASNLAAFGINMSGEPSATLAEIKKTAPFDWKGFAVTVVREAVWQRRLDGARSVNEALYIYDGAAMAVAARLSDADNAVGYKMLASVITRSADRLAPAEVSLYMSVAAQYGLNVNWLFDRAFEKYTAYSVRDEATLDFVFAAACTLSDDRKKADIIAKLIQFNIKSPFFMPVYAKHAVKNKELFARLENMLLSSAQGGAEFMAQKDAYMFRNETDITFDILQNYFRKYYEKGHDSDGVFASKVKLYLDKFAGAQKVNESLRIYRLVGLLKDTFADVNKVLVIAAQQIFSLPLDELLKIGGKKEVLNDLCALSNRAYTALVHNNTYCLFFMQATVLGWFDPQSLIVQNKLYQYLPTPQIKSAYLEKCFDSLPDLYFDQKKRGKIDCVTLMRGIFGMPLDSAAGMRKLRDWLDTDKRAAELFGDMMSVAFNYNDPFAARANQFVQEYVNTLNVGVAKKLLKKAATSVYESLRPRVEMYVDEFCVQHRTFWEKLFGKDKKEKDKKEKAEKEKPQNEPPQTEKDKNKDKK